MNKLQSTMHDKLFAVYDKYGLGKTLQIAHASLKARLPSLPVKQRFNGEICEAILEIIVVDWVKRSGVDARYVRSLVIPDTKGKNKEFLTEIDMVIFTPWCVYCIECKNYGGDKQLVDDGLLIGANGVKCDVFKQNSMHLEVLHNLIGGLSASPMYQMLLFNFSNGSIDDKRVKSAKSRLPLVDENTLLSIVARGGSSNWDMVGVDRVIPILEKYSDANRDRHLQYVQGVRKSNE